ncbi:ATP-dependent RNA helicase Mrh4p, mitochondrial [Trichomonascus vanleenenianus]|uniref:ATP-dependent RNA helicase n=1 Tax=Trichomonascus vanleenenianus TaxID=2268995 RepID=UPI003ECAF6A0
MAPIKMQDSRGLPTKRQDSRGLPTKRQDSRGVRSRKQTVEKEFIAGPPNSGEFARLHYLTKRERIAHKNTIQKVQSFESLRIDASVRQAIVTEILGHLETIKPTAVQTLAIKAIRSAKRSKTSDVNTYLIAAETGSGKTLAYLAPMLSELKEQEQNAEEWDKIKDAPIIRSVVLVPTLELISQVQATMKKLAGHAKFSFMAAGQGISAKSSSAKLTKRIDVLITTPERFRNMFKDPATANGRLKYCQFMVVDEADSLMDDSFCESTHAAVQMVPKLRHLVFCSATIPRSFDRLMTKTYPNAVRIVTPGIHRVPRHIDFRVIEVFKPPFLNSKQLALQQALYAIHHDNTEEGLVKRVVVFVNKSDDVQHIVDMLNEKGYPAVGATGRLTKDERTAVLEEFVTPAPPAGNKSDSVNVKVLVTTDLLARGVDMDRVRNVVLYDLPYSSVDLLHRAGRTGRLGKRGRVFLFVGKSESRGWVKGLERVVRNGMPLA